MQSRYQSIRSIRMCGQQMMMVIMMGSTAYMSGCGHDVLATGVLVNSSGMEMVKLSTGYYVSKYETRQREYEVIMGHNPSSYKQPDCPVGNITVAGAREFCRTLTERERAAGTLPVGYAYRLPTYEEWLQYVADAPLAGSVTPEGGKGGSQLAGPLIVGSGERNRLGLYDLRGNVAEYTADVSPSGAAVTVGAFWNEHRKDFLRVRSKSWFENAGGHSMDRGFRCILAPEE